MLLLFLYTYFGLLRRETKAADIQALLTACHTREMMAEVARVNSGSESAELKYEIFVTNLRPEFQ